MKFRWVRIIHGITFSLAAATFTVLMLASCVTKNIGQTTEPILRVQPDCVKLVVAGDWPALSDRINQCRNDQNSEGISTLMMSIYKNQTEIFKNLLSSGSDVSLKDHSGTDALFYAVNFHRTEMVRELRQRGAAITMNDFKVNALWLALQKSKLDVIQALNPTKDEVNIQGEDGWTAIYFAIRREEEPLFDLILAAGANVNLFDSEGVSPYVFAKDEVKWLYAQKRLAPLTALEFKKKK